MSLEWAHSVKVIGPARDYDHYLTLMAAEQATHERELSELGICLTCGEVSVAKKS